MRINDGGWSQDGWVKYRYWGEVVWRFSVCGRGGGSVIRWWYLFSGGWFSEVVVAWVNRWTIS